MSLLRRRMMMQSVSKGFEYVYDPTRGGTPIDDGWTFEGDTYYTNMTNVDGLGYIYVGRGGSYNRLWLPNHLSVENCSLEIELSYQNTDIAITLCDDEYFAQCRLTRWNNRKYIGFPTNDTGGGTVLCSTAVPSGVEPTDVFYTMKLEKNGNKCSMYLNDVCYADQINCKTLGQTHHPNRSYSCVDQCGAGAWSFGDRGYVYIKRLIYKEW